MSKKNINLPAWTRTSTYLVLFAVTGMYFLTLFDLPWLEAFELDRYEWVWMTVLVAALIIAGAFRIPRFWCRYFCPVGSIAEVAETLPLRKERMPQGK